MTTATIESAIDELRELRARLNNPSPGVTADDLDELLRRERILIPKARAEQDARRLTAEIENLRSRLAQLMADERIALERAQTLRLEASEADREAARFRAELSQVTATLERLGATNLDNANHKPAL